jgi:prevent-host-death family protein
MEVINIHEAKTHLSKLVERVVGGEEIIIAKAGKPVAKLVPFQAEPPCPRKPGSMRGKIKILPGFDAADKQIADLFNGNHD